MPVLYAALELGQPESWPASKNICNPQRAHRSPNLIGDNHLSEQQRETPTIPLTKACAVLAEHGVKISYRHLWLMAVDGLIPSVRRAGRIILVGDSADLARIVAHELASRQRAPRQAA